MRVVSHPSALKSVSTYLAPVSRLQAPLLEQRFGEGGFLKEPSTELRYIYCFVETGAKRHKKANMCHLHHEFYICFDL